MPEIDGRYVVIFLLLMVVFYILGFVTACGPSPDDLTLCLDYLKGR